MGLPFKTNRLKGESMPEITSFRSVIDLWGSREALAAELGVESRKVSKWWQRDSVPDDWWAAIVALPVAAAAGLTPEILMKLAAGRRRGTSAAEAAE
jgi:hypothetical protein